MTDEQYPTTPQKPDQPSAPLQAPPPHAVPGANYPPPHYAYAYDPRANIKAPAIGLIIAGILSMVSIAFIFLAPQLVDSLVVILEQQNTQIAQEDLDGLIIQLKQAADPTNPKNILTNSITLAGGLFTMIAGFYMLRLRKWNFCLIGAILSIVPFTSCCCTGAPLGIWALIVLTKEEIKMAFRQLRA